MWYLALAHAAVPLVAPTTEAPTAPPPVHAAPPVGIVGGEAVEASAWPAVVAIFNVNDEFACTGTLVAPDLVLTAGHCGLGMETVGIGSTDLRDSVGETYAIAEAWVHPESYATYDVALFRLDRAVDGVTPPALVTDCWATDYLYDGAEGVIVGYGAIDAWATDRPTVLHEAVVPLVDADCAQAQRGCNPEVLPGGELIAGGDGIDSCSGDSGGPLFLDTAEGLLLAGVTSRAAEPVRQPCGDGGIYVRVDAVVPWIEATTGVALPRPDCEATNRAPVLRTPGLETSRLRPIRVRLEVDDPNEGQSHTFTITSQPDFGEAWLDGDRLTFVPDGPDFGATAIGLRIEDDGDPPRAVDTELPLQVLDVIFVTEPGTGGCRTGPTGAGLAAWWLAFGLIRRRAGRPRRRGAAGPAGAPAGRSAG